MNGAHSESIAMSTSSILIRISCHPDYKDFAYRPWKYVAQNNTESINARVRSVPMSWSHQITFFFHFLTLRYVAGAVAAKSSSSCDSTSDNYGTEFFKVISWEIAVEKRLISVFLPFASNIHPPSSRLTSGLLWGLQNWLGNRFHESTMFNRWLLIWLALVSAVFARFFSASLFNLSGYFRDDIIEDCCSDIRDGDSDGEEIVESKAFHVTILLL